MNDEETAEHDEYLRQSTNDADARGDRMAGPKQDTLIRFLLIGVAIVTVVTLGVGFITAPYIISGANNSDQVIRGNDLQACRSALAAKVTDARTSLDRANAELNLALSDALAALLANDKAATTAAALAASQARADISATSPVLTDANAAYQAGITRSQKDPDGFLSTCRSLP